MTPKIPPQIETSIENLCLSTGRELVFGLTYAVGTDYKPVQESIEQLLKQYDYETKVIRVSELIASMTDYPLLDDSEINRISSRMGAGNAECKACNRRDLWALAAIGEINRLRGNLGSTDERRVAYIILSLKRPHEVAALRKVYGPGFFLIGVFATESERLGSLIEKNAPKQDAIELIRRDEDERADDFGQKTSKTFQLADVFVQLRDRAYLEELERFFALVFSSPYETPTQHEHAMFLAYASSLRSGQLGRQVGASITSKSGDVISVGCNDVPKAGGGLYWPGAGDRRDHVLGYDSNDFQIDQMTALLMGRLAEKEGQPRTNAEELRKEFRGCLEITEYGRAVHAEMDALFTCLRNGVNPVGGTLYVTTFPCHNCTRHIIAAGIQRVYYIEPYPKSKAWELHEDAILIEERVHRQHRGPRWKLPFTHFVGIGPRRYFDLFSLSLSSGFELERKVNGKTLSWSKSESWPRIPLSPLSYFDREKRIIEEIVRFPQTSLDNEETSA
jgi:deoxycytidylate deaminase